LDGWFVSDGTATWDSFVFNAVSTASPHYPDRLYPDDQAENAGAAISNRRPPSTWVGDGIGRWFIVRIPPLEPVDEDGSYALDPQAPLTNGDGMFVANGADVAGSESDGSVTSFISTDNVLSGQLYDAIVSAAESAKGQGMRCEIVVDPLL